MLMSCLPYHFVDGAIELGQKQEFRPSEDAEGNILSIIKDGNVIFYSKDSSAEDLFLFALDKSSVTPLQMHAPGFMSDKEMVRQERIGPQYYSFPGSDLPRASVGSLVAIVANADGKIQGLTTEFEAINSIDGSQPDFGEQRMSPVF